MGCSTSSLSLVLVTQCWRGAECKGPGDVFQVPGGFLQPGH